VRKATARGVLAASMWDCTTDRVGQNGPWRSTPPALTGAVRGRVDVPAELRLKPLLSVGVFKNGVQTATYNAEQIGWNMFPEQILFYEPVQL
jgi:hypothetical protein